MAYDEQLARAYERQDELRDEVRAHSFARIDLAAACRWALWELEFGEVNRAKEELRKVAHLSKQGWWPERGKKGIEVVRVGGGG